jgi:hypothetical protein
MIRVEAEALPDGLPGHARMVVTGTSLPAGRIVYQLRREGYASGFLGRGGWQTTEEHLAPLDVVTLEAGAWAIVMGPEVSRHMMEAPYQLRLLDQDFGIFWPYIEEFVPGTVYVPQGGRPPEAAPLAPERVSFEPAKAAPVPTPMVTPVSVIAPPPAPIWKKPAFVVAVLVLLLAGGGVAMFQQEVFGDRAPRQVVAQPTPPVTPSAQPSPTAGPAWPAGTDGMTPREVVAAAPNPAGILRVAQMRQQQGRFDDAIPLLETAAERNEAEAWFILARLYDPVDFVAGRPFQEPSGYEAARHYREAVRRGVAAAEAPRAALRSFLQTRADSGDSDARNALAEFWP